MDYSYIGKGKVFLRDLNAALGLIFVGNVSALTFGVTEDSKELKDYTQGGGGTYNEVKRIESVESGFTMHDLSPENLARVLYGITSAATAATVTDESHAGAIQGAYIGTNFLASAITTVKVGATTAVADTDYTVSGSGIIPIVGSLVITAGATVLITYPKVAQDIVQALVSSGSEYEMVFDGLNEARSGKRCRVTAHRIKVGAAQSLGLIGDDYAALEVTGKVLKDTTKNGTSISQYFKVEMQA